MTGRKKPGVVFWASVVVTALMLYPLSFGPACWWLSNPPVLAAGQTLDYPIDNDSEGPFGCMFDSGVEVPRIYWPIGWLALCGPKSIGNAFSWYAHAGKPLDYLWLPADPNGGLLDSHLIRTDVVRWGT